MGKCDFFGEIAYKLDESLADLIERYGHDFGILTSEDIKKGRKCINDMFELRDHIRAVWGAYSKVDSVLIDLERKE